jgi:hypothetical protein
MLRPVSGSETRRRVQIGLSRAEIQVTAELVSVIRQRISVVSLAAWALLVAVVLAVTGDVAVVALVVFAYLYAEAIGVLRTVPGIDERWVSGAIGTLATAASVVWLWTELSQSATVESVWPAVAALVAGCWLLLDTWADFVEGRRLSTDDAFDDLSGGEAMLVMQHGSLVADELQAEPKTVSELAEACDLTESRVRHVTELFGHDDTIYPVDPTAENPRYAVDEQKLGATALGRQAAGGLGALLDRISRPVEIIVTDRE